MATPALTQEPQEGRACATSDECGELYCIDERCRDTAHASEQALRAATPLIMFGDGHGYQMQILVGDLLASISAPLLIALASLTDNSLFGFLAVLPPSLTGPIIHMAHKRWAPGFISFFGWAAIAPSAVGIGVLAAASTGSYDVGVGIATFVGVAAAGAVLMTVVDYYFARDVTKVLPRVDDHTVRLAPSVVPVRGGGLAGVRGSFW